MNFELVELSVSDLLTRRVKAAKIMLGLSRSVGYIVAVLDSDTNEFVQIGGLPQGHLAAPLSLSPDGEHLVLSGPVDSDGYYGLCVHTLATSRQRWLDARADGEDRVAALAPNNQHLATLATAYDGDDDVAVINLIDIESHQRRRIWSAPGGWSAETTISWSPDGKLIAATYVNMDEEWATAAVDLNGNLIAHYDQMAIAKRERSLDRRTPPDRLQLKRRVDNPCFP